MFRWVNVAATLATLSLLAACTSGQQASQGGTSVVPSAAGTGFHHAMSPDKDCGGAHGVTVKPCPVHLTKHTGSGVLVTVGGPGVVSSVIGDINGCFNGRQCYKAKREGSSQIQWRFTSGKSCGAADVEIDAMNASGQEVGYFFLKVSNKYCHHH
ncbi:MAG TPA: hypothetical protein VHR97_12605 [Candidatus Baltobacteraceae bacterium]|jgi:hypothetical protein|nr:hypothetical protein [Candidatus Baltobacteraceae bacterium]